MKGALFIILYGLACIGSVAIGSVWLKVGLRGLARLNRGQPLDMFCWIAFGLFVGALSNILIFGTRTATSLREGFDPAIVNIPYAPLIMIGLVLLFVSKAMLMWAHDPTHKSVSWRWFAFFSVLWVFVAPVLLMI